MPIRLRALRSLGERSRILLQKRKGPVKLPLLHEGDGGLVVRVLRPDRAGAGRQQAEDTWQIRKCPARFALVSWRPWESPFESPPRCQRLEP